MSHLDEYIMECIGDSLFVSVTGSGGKTSLLKLLGHSFKERGDSVLLSTTTKFQSPDCYDWGVDQAAESLEKLNPQDGRSCLYGKVHTPGSKWMCPGMQELGAASIFFDVTLVEADGSGKMPLKFHTERDPVIHPLSDYTIALFGAFSVGKMRKEVAFGYEGEDGIVDKAFLESYLQNQECILKGNPDLILVNGMDAVTEEAREILYSLDWPKVPIVFGSIQRNEMERVINGEC